MMKMWKSLYKGIASNLGITIAAVVWLYVLCTSIPDYGVVTAGIGATLITSVVCGIVCWMMCEEGKTEQRRQRGWRRR